jgi:GH24 family phage-related lysozyme (muramidase)
MKVSGAGVTLIKEFEGFPHGGRPYRDIVGVWTIGYGHTEGVSAGSRRLTQQQASELLRHDLDRRYAVAVNALHLPLNQHQFDALVSFVYNCGARAVSAENRIGRELRAKHWAAAADALLAWDKAGGVPVAGLTRRRKAERAMFLAADDPLEGYPDDERRWIREYDRLRRQNEDPERRRSLRRAMAEQRRKIWHSAQPGADGGDGHGWEAHQRRARYASLLARTSS